MKKISFAAGVALFGMFAASIPALAQDAATPKANSPKAQEVLKVVRSFQEAGIKGDTATLSKIFDADVVHFHPGSPYRFVGGSRLVDEFYVAAHSVQDARFEMVDPMVQFPAPTVAVVSYYIIESYADKEGHRTNVKEKASEVYQQKGDSWVMILGHYSPAD